MTGRLIISMVLLLSFNFVLSSRVLAETNMFQKLVTLRFANELRVEAKDGEADISSLGSNNFVHVQGQALFFPGQFIDPQYYEIADFRVMAQEEKAIVAPLMLKSLAFALEKTDQNFGTFAVALNSVGKRDLSIVIPRFYHALDVYVVDKHGMQRVLELGKVDPVAKNNRNFAEYSPPQPSLKIDGNFFIYAYASSPVRDGKNLLNFSSFYVGETAYLNDAMALSRFLSSALSGCFLIVFIFYLFIFVFRRTDRSSLYLALFAFCSFGLSILHSVELGIAPNGTLELYTMVNILGILFLNLYLIDKTQVHLQKKFASFLKWMAIGTAVFGNVSEFFRWDDFTNLIFVCAFFLSNYLIIKTIYLGYKHNIPAIGYFLIGAILNGAFQFPIMISSISNANFEYGYFILLANLVMALALGLVNAKDFAMTYLASVQQREALEVKNAEVNYLNKNLEHLVDAKTKEVKAILDNIPQGILTIGRDGLIDEQYSAHLKIILEIDEIASLSFKSVFLDRCVMDGDQKSLIWNSVKVICGEDGIAFEMNSDHLPKEVAFTCGEQVKQLKVTWNAELDENLTISRLLVTLLDITIERKLQITATEKQDELTIVEELLSVSGAKFAQFFHTSKSLLIENKKIADNEQLDVDPQVLKMIFVNAHTVKGAARTLQLKSLAHILHEMEDDCHGMLEQRLALNKDRLKELCNACVEVLEKYRSINRDKLNRVDDYGHVLVNRGTLEDQYHLYRSLLETKERGIEEFRLNIQQRMLTIESYIFENLLLVFDTYKESAVKIAKDLGKAEPIFEFDIKNVKLLPEKRAVLDNCMIHILRNALDHGVEYPEERIKQGKGPRGRIFVNSLVQGNELVLQVKDDGRGLAMDSLRERGRQKGHLNEKSTNQEIAELVFLSGLSTAQSVSQISGRGIGMDAVRTFLETEGGRISVQLFQPKSEQRGFYDFALVIHLPLGQAMTLAS